jgi:hypothetical protein
MNVDRAGLGPGTVDCAGCDGTARVSDGVNFILPLWLADGLEEGCDGIWSAAASSAKPFASIGSKVGSENRALRNVAFTRLSLLGSPDASLVSRPLACSFVLSLDTFRTKRAISFQSTSFDTK